MLEERNHLIDDDIWRHDAEELGQVDGGLSPDHWGIIVDKLGKVLAQSLLGSGVGLCICDLVDASGGDLCGEPVCF